MPRNRYLEDRAMRRRYRDRTMDGRNPYGSRGGYVRSDKAMDNRNYDSERDSRNYDRNNSDYRGQDYHRSYEQSRESYRPMQYEMYGVGGLRPRMNDYNDYGHDYARGSRRDYNDYNDYGNYDRDYAAEEESYKKELKELTHKLKKTDRFNLGEEEIIKKAKSMGIKFDDYNEEEYIATYYMMQSDFPGIANDPHSYLAMAKSFLEDKDAKLQGSEKLCKYIYAIVLGEDEE